MKCWNHSYTNWFWFISFHRNSARIHSVFEYSLFHLRWPQFRRNNVDTFTTCLKKECQVQRRRCERLCWEKFSAVGINEWRPVVWTYLDERNFVDVRVEKLAIRLSDCDINPVMYRVKRNETVPVNFDVIKICSRRSQAKWSSMTHSLVFFRHYAQLGNEVLCSGHGSNPTWF